MQAIASGLPQNVIVEHLKIEMENDFMFPWSAKKFLSAMPDAVLGKSKKLKPPYPQASQYDLIVLGVQPWYLSISTPVWSALNSPQYLALFKSAPVLSVFTARNMWTRSYQQLRNHFSDQNIQYGGHIVLEDPNYNWISGISILIYMLFGKKKTSIPFLPSSGVPQEMIKKSAEVGTLLTEATNNRSTQDRLVLKGWVPVRAHYILLERRAYLIFSKWAAFLSNRSKTKSIFLFLFALYLSIALYIISFPVLILLKIYMVMNKKKKNKLKRAYQGLTQFHN